MKAKKAKKQQKMKAETISNVSTSDAEEIATGKTTVVKRSLEKKQNEEFTEF